MSEFYDQLLRAADNTKDITVEKYGIITKISGYLCSVKEIDTELEHSDVPILNGLNLQTGDKVILGFANNSIYNVFVIGAVGEKRLYSKAEVDEIVEEIEQGEINIDDYDVGFTFSFGLGGVDDTISIHTFIEKINN